MDEKAVIQLVEKTIAKSVKPELDKLRARLDEREKKIEQREKKLEERFGELNERFTTFTHKVFSFLEEQDKKINQMNEGLNEKFNKVFSTLDFIIKRVETVETEYFAITQTLKRIELKLTSWNGKILLVDDLQQKTKELYDKTQELEKRINQLGL
jgi:predicted nuclease with TOPRIM domain